MRKIAALAALLAALTFTACTSDDVANNGETDEGQPITISLAIAADDAGAASTSSTRRQTRASSWSYDKDYTEGEGIYSWFVVMVRLNDDKSGTVEKYYASSTVDLTATAPDYRSNLKEDGIDDKVETTTGKVVFYNFANLSPEEVCTAAGLSTTDIKTAGTALSADQLAALDNATYALNGNGFDPTATRTDAADNHLKGIPMSGRQAVTLSWKEHYNQKLTLWVVRMLAKIEVKFTNSTGYDVTITKVGLSPLTKNSSDNSNASNLYLLPNYTPSVSRVSELKASDETTQKPHLVVTEGSVATTTDYAYEPTNISIDNNGTTTCTFYVNESDIQYGDNIGFGEFFLNVGLTYTDSETSEVVKKNQRYALITDNTDGEWSYIARNDRRTIPVTLQDYKLTLVPYDYPPIGVLPSSVQGDDGTFTCTFHAGGDFHLVPKVTKYSTSATVAVTMSNATWKNLHLENQDGTRIEDANGDPAWSTLFSTTPVWASQWETSDGNTYNETGDYIHGTFQYGLTANYTSRHRLTVQISDGTTARTFLSPVIIKYEYEP